MSEGHLHSCLGSQPLRLEQQADEKPGQDDCSWAGKAYQHSCECWSLGIPLLSNPGLFGDKAERIKKINRDMWHGRKGKANGQKGSKGTQVYKERDGSRRERLLNMCKVHYANKVSTHQTTKEPQCLCMRTLGKLAPGNWTTWLLCLLSLHQTDAQLTAHLGAGSIVRGISEPHAQYRKVLNCWFLVLCITKLVSMEGWWRKVQK